MSAVKRFAFLLCLLLLFVPGCDDGPTQPARQLGSLEVISGNNQTATVATTLAEPLAVRAVDVTGRPMAGLPINFVVVSGGGSVFASSQTTNSQGIAFQQWRLGNSTSITQAVEARAIDPVTGVAFMSTFNATATSDQPAELRPLTEQVTGTAGQTLSQPVRVEVRDRFGNVVPNATVGWSVVSGGGSVSPQQSTTDSAGIAATNWTLGNGAGTQQIQASISSDSDVITANATASPPVSIERISGDQQQGTVGEALPAQLAVRVTDQFGNPVPNVRIDWVLPVNSDVPTPGPLTGSDGIAHAVWELGTIAGQQTAIAHIGVDSTSFTAQAAPGPAANIGISPDTVILTQIGDTARLRAFVRDQYGNVINADGAGWNNSDGAIALSETGLATARLQGSSVVTGVWGSLVDTAEVRVQVFGSERVLRFINWHTGTSTTTPHIDARIHGDHIMAKAWNSSGGPYFGRLYDVNPGTLRLQFHMDGNFDIGSMFAVGYSSSGWDATVVPLAGQQLTSVGETVITVATSAEWVAYEHWTGQSRFSAGTFHGTKVRNMTTGETRTVSTTARLPGQLAPQRCGAYPSFGYPHLALMDSGWLKIYNLETTTTTTIAPFPDELRVAVDGGRVAWHRSEQVYVHDLTSGVTTNVSATAGIAGHCPSISGNWLVWNDGTSDGVLYNIANGSVRRFWASGTMTIQGNRILRRTETTFRLLELYP